MQYVLIEIESLEKANILYMTDTEKDMRKTIKLMETLGKTSEKNLVVVTYEFE